MPFDAQFDEKQSPLLVNAALNYFDLSSTCITCTDKWY